MVTVAVVIGAGGCSTPDPPPAAASNEFFPPQPGPLDDGSVVKERPDDRWASIVLTETQDAEVRAVLAEAADGVEGLQPLGPAPHGVRFEDVPNAMLNAAPKVEMAILRSVHLDPGIEVDFRDPAGREATARVRFTLRGPLADVAYRIPGTDADPDRARLLAAMERCIRAWPIGAMPEEVASDLVRVLGESGAIVSDRTITAERWRYTLLMLDEEEAEIEIRRVPPPRVVEWTATAGLFPRPEVARSLGETFMECLRAWGRENRWNGGRTTSAE